LRSLLDTLYRLSGVLAALFLVAICVTVALQVLSAILDNALQVAGMEALGLTIPSYGELTGFFLVAATFFALAYTLRAGGHVRVNLFIRVLHGKPRRAVEIFNVLGGLLLAGMLTWYTTAMVYDAWRFNDLTSGSLVLPEWIPKLPMALGSAILFIALVDELVTLLSGGQPAYASGDQGELNPDPDE